MTWGATAAVEDFPEAAEWFRSKIPVTHAVADTLADYAGPRAFTVAGVTQLEVVEEVHRSLLRAIETGVPFETWKGEIEATLTESWGKKNSARLETIFQNATSQAYSAGRWRQMHEPSVLRFRPYGMFDGVDDAHQTPICRAWDGKILPLERFAELGMVPQCHHRCRSQIRNMRESEAMRRGVTIEPPTETAAPGFGKAPTESEWSPDPSKYDRDLYTEYTLKRSELARTTKRPRLDE